MGIKLSIPIKLTFQTELKQSQTNHIQQKQINKKIFSPDKRMPANQKNPLQKFPSQQPTADSKRVQFLREQQRLQKERIKKLYQQINIQKQKSQRLQNEHRERMKKMYEKIYAQNSGNPYLKPDQQSGDENDTTQVPVDGEVYLGSRVYMINCAGCHSLQSTTNNADNGPSLGMIYNRKVATDINYLHYSKQAIERSFFWTSKNLFNFMLDPLRFIPGTRCGLALKPIPSESDRADLVTFLKQYSKQLELNTRIELIKREGYEMYQTKLYAERVKNQKIQKDLKPKE